MAPVNNTEMNGAAKSSVSDKKKLFEKAMKEHCESSPKPGILLYEIKLY